jgi:GGDEF domain-containing protein
VKTDVDKPIPGQATDRLTGFGNRSALLRDLEQAVEPGSAPRTLAIFDLRGYAEAYGRIEGDSLLREISAALSEALAGVRIYRSRADELAVLVEGPEAVTEPRLLDAVAALNARFGRLNVVIAFGAATLPAEADAATVALRIADARHYLHNRGRRERRLVPRSS